MSKILVVDGITKEYPGRVAVSGVSFEVTQGSIHGFLGPNGAGKSTTMRMIAGLIPPTSGTMSLFGEILNPSNLNPSNLKWKNQIGLLPENPPLYLDMSVEKYLELIARFHKMDQIKERVDRVLTELSLKDVRKRIIGNLSKGYKQRVGLGQAIIYDAPFLILDEPTNGLDPQSVVELRDYIKKLAETKTILFSSHILPEVEQLCDQITIIHQGKVRASGDLQEIHRKFKQGLCVKVGLGVGEELPDLSKFGKFEVTHHHTLSSEEQFTISFNEDKDFRSELGKYLITSGKTLMTLQNESPELEDIFLHMTETQK